MSKLSIVVPVFNEERCVKLALERLFALALEIPIEWIVVDDGSTDDTWPILKELESKYVFKLIRMTQDSGKGAAIVAGVREVTGNFVMIHDADFEYDPRDIPALLKPLLLDEADAVYGSRFKKTAVQVHRTYHYFSNFFLTFCSNLLSGVFLTDMQTCYKIFRTDLVQPMQLLSKRFGFEIEVTAYLAKTRARVFELPIHYCPRTKLQGKKINWKDGVAALWHLVHFNCFVSFDHAFEGLPSKYHPETSVHYGLEPLDCIKLDLKTKPAARVYSKIS